MLCRGAISKGIDHPTGDAADNPPSAMLIQKKAYKGVRSRAAPRIPSPSVVPPIRTACFFFQAEDGIRDYKVTGVQTCALPICDVDEVAADAEDHMVVTIIAS